VPAFGATRFDISYIVPVGYAIFAMALGICAGTLLRRALPALAVTLAGFAALRVLTTWLRPHYMTPVTAYYKLAGRALPGNQPWRPKRAGGGRLETPRSCPCTRCIRSAPDPGNPGSCTVSVLPFSW
jgi:hypothetical protein